MNRLIDAAVGHGRTVLATLVLVLIAGTYAYVTGQLKQFQGNPNLPPIVELVVTDPDQITDDAPG